MTTITPELRDQFIEKFGYAGSSGSFKGVRDEEIMKWVADREALARAEGAKEVVSIIRSGFLNFPDEEEQIQDTLSLGLAKFLTQPSNTDL